MSQEVGDETVNAWPMVGRMNEGDDAGTRGREKATNKFVSTCLGSSQLCLRQRGVLWADKPSAPVRFCFRTVSRAPRSNLKGEGDRKHGC